MKITKDQLKQMVLQELKALDEADEAEKLKTGELAGQAVQQRKAMMGGGIKDEERALIAKVSKKLAAAAKRGNILSGPVARKIQILATQIDKLLGEPEEDPAAVEQDPAAVQEGKKK